MDNDELIDVIFKLTMCAIVIGVIISVIIVLWKQ